MTRSDHFKSNHKISSIFKKIGVTFIIPIFLAITGVIVILVSGWNYISPAFEYVESFFSKPTENSEYKRRVYRINNQDVYRPFLGEAFAKIKIDSIGLEQTVYEGDDDSSLIKGIGHYSGSTLPGENGNVLLAGHRDQLNGFEDLKDIKVGDQVIIEVSYGTYYYKVSDVYITDPDDAEPGKVSDHEKLTMYTCYPFEYVGAAPHRYIVVCDYEKVE